MRFLSVLYDGEQQRFERHLGDQRGAVFPHPHQGVLDEFLGAYRRHEARGVGAERFVIAAEKRIETFFIPRTEQSDNRAVVVYVDRMRVICHRPVYSSGPPPRRTAEGQSKNTTLSNICKKDSVQGIQCARTEYAGGKPRNRRGQRRVRRQGRRRPGTAAYCRRLGEHPAARRECVTAQAGKQGAAWTRIPWRQAGIFPAYVRKSQPRSGNPPNFITFAGQARPVAAGRGRERKVRATQSTAQANDLISVRV